MLIRGEWQLFDDGVIRPIIRVKVHGADDQVISANFLVDPGADRTVFSASLVLYLGLPVRAPQAGYSITGIGGASDHVLVDTMMEFTRDDGGMARVKAEFAGFTDEAATGLNILGRDVLNNFDLIMSYQRGEVLLLSQRHRYLVEFV